MSEAIRLRQQRATDECLTLAAHKCPDCQGIWLDVNHTPTKIPTNTPAAKAEKEVSQDKRKSLILLGLTILCLAVFALGVWVGSR